MLAVREVALKAVMAAKWKSSHYLEMSYLALFLEKDKTSLWLNGLSNSFLLLSVVSDTRVEIRIVIVYLKTFL